MPGPAGTPRSGPPPSYGAFAVPVGGGADQPLSDSTMEFEPVAAPVTAPRRGWWKRRPRWVRVLAYVGAVLLLLVTGAVVAADVLLHRYTAAIQQKPMLGSAAAVPPPAKGVPPLHGPLNVLLVGVDERTVTDDPGGTRADSIIILHINAAHTAGYMLSVPRDTLVHIPPFARTGFGGSYEKINAAFVRGGANGGGRAGGFELLAMTVRNLTGIRFNAGAIINFAGFQAVVRALGGVDMCVDQRVTSIHLNSAGQDLKTAGGTPQVYLPGCQHLNSWQALDYVRQRHLAEGDYDRQRHQQQFIKAVAKQTMSKGVWDPVMLDRVLVAAGHTLTVDPGSAPLTDWLFLLQGIGTNQLSVLRTNGGHYDSITCPDGASCQRLTPDSLQMFAAARDDTLPAFIASHPSWVAPGG